MTTEELGKVLNYFKAFYSNWKLDIENPIVLMVWYNCLKDISYKEMMDLVAKYCMQNKFGPASPNDLLSLIPKLSSTDEAWEILLDILTRASEPAIALNMLAKYPELYAIGAKYINRMNEVECDSAGNKCYGYQLGRAFKREYQAMLGAQKLYIDSKTMRLAIPNKTEMLTYQNEKELMEGLKTP